MNEPVQMEMIELLPEEDQQKIALVNALFERARIALDKQFDEVEEAMFREWSPICPN